MRSHSGIRFKGYILFFSVYIAAFLIAFLFLQDYFYLVSPYVDTIDPDYVDWYVSVRDALPYEDLLKNTYTCLNYLAMFAELVVFLEIFLKKENRSLLSRKIVISAVVVVGIVYVLFRQSAKHMEHCLLYMPMVPWVLIAAALLIFLVQMQRYSPDAPDEEV